VAAGCVGAGTGTAALGFKAGVGTASRRLRLADGGEAVLGAPVQANFSGTLTVRGIRIEVQAALGATSAPARTDPTAEPLTEPTAEPLTEPTAEPLTDPTSEPLTEPTAEPAGNSCLIIFAIDRPLDGGSQLSSPAYRRRTAGWTMGARS
jgi:L-aminopeptidase/D-esterase-like protein